MHPEPPTPATLLAMREAAGLTQERAAVAAGVSVTSLWRYETGRLVPSSHVLRSLFAAYERVVGEGTKP